MVVVDSVYVKIAGDEEWRSYYGGSWMQTANTAIETADDEMYAQFGVNLMQYGYANWDSNPDSGNVTACTLLGDLTADLSPGTSDILIGFSKNYSTNWAGCSELGGDEAEIMWASSGYDRWVTLQHEVSHLFNVPDRYPDPNGLHQDDVMEYQYSNPDFWCSTDWAIFNSHKTKFN